MSHTEEDALEHYFHIGLDRIYKVPRFQRGYSWKSEHVTDFLTDIENLDNDRHYFGMFFFRESGHKREIIDGQQRITSVVLYLIACRDYLKEKFTQTTNKNQEHNDIIVDLEKRLRSYNQKNILELGKTNERIFVSMYDYKDCNTKITELKNHIESDTDRHLINAYEQMYKKIKDKDFNSINNNIKNLFEKFYVREIAVSTVLVAFKIFETINDRGEPLAQTDLVKNYIFESLENNGHSKTKLDEFDQLWSEIVKRITGNDKYKFDDFVRHVLKIEFQIEEKKNDLYKGLRILLQKPNNSPENFIKKLEEWSRLFSKLRNPHSVTAWQNRELIEYLKIFKILQAKNVYPALMIGYKEMSVKDFEELTKFLFKYQVRVKQIMGRSESNISNTSMKIVDEIFRCKKNIKLHEILKPIKDDEQRHNPTFEKSVELFAPNRDPITKYILQNVKGEKRIESEVEHIMPLANSEWRDDIIKWNKFDGDDDQIDTQVKTLHTSLKDMIGNQMLLETSINRSIGNKNFTEKKKEYANSIFSDANEITKKNKWTKKEIDERQKKLSETIVRLFTL